MPAKNARARKRSARADRTATTAGASAAKAQTTAKSHAKAKAGRAARQIRKSGMSANMKVTLGIVAAALVALIGVVVLNQGDDDSGTATVASELLVRPDSHRLSTAADGKVTVVEFLDFECESCLAAYPGVERLRAEYGDRITYVVRYFPIPSHQNAYTAAHAAEAAARQGKFEPMYKKLFDTTAAWAHQREPQTAVFEGYAQELGLDMTRYRADVASADVAARVKADAADGEALGVQGTPTFFINGTRFTDRPTYDGLKAAIDPLLAS